MYKAEILADSKNHQGDRITTMKITFPRIMLAEFNTHRMFSRNSASSRAIPFNKMVKMVEENPFIPLAWQKDHKGMQGTEYESHLEHIKLNNIEWLEARDSAIEHAKVLNEKGNVTKQLCNRLLEPFMWHTVIVTATSWSNFFELRCPQYIYEDKDDYDDIIESLTFKSKKDYINYFKNQGYSVDRVYLRDFTGQKRPKKFLSEMTDLDWLLINKSQADIHIQAIAELMWDAMNESTPEELEAGEWHIPNFGHEWDSDKLLEITKGDLSKRTEARIKISTAHNARISYETLGDNPKIDYEADIRLHDMLVQNGHASPLEHVAQSQNDSDWYANFKGFKSYRKILGI